jgi:cell division transport system ATP-binding protein
MIINANNIELTYDKKISIIKNANFEINRKDFVFIGGTSGSGKSTLLKSLYANIKPKNGQLIVNGYNINKLSKKSFISFRKDIGIIFQDYKLIPEYTIEENIMLPLKINQYSKNICIEQANKLLSHVKLTHAKGLYPNQLSGGEQQRVAVARALAHNPSIIFADEPTGNLDEFSADVIWGLLKSANTQLGITIVAVTHKIPLNFGIKFRKLSLENGKVYESF